MGLLRREKKEKPLIWLVDLHGAETIVEYFFRKYSFLSRDYNYALMHTLTGINYFCSNYAMERKTLNKNEIKQLAIATLKFMSTGRMAEDDLDYHWKFIAYWTEYCSDYLESEEDGDVLSYLARCLTISGLFKLYCRYVGEFADEFENGEEHKRVRKGLLSILDDGKTTYDLIEYWNKHTIDKNGESILDKVYNATGICTVVFYKELCNNSKLNELFDAFKENELSREVEFTSDRPDHF